MSVVLSGTQESEIPQLARPAGVSRQARRVALLILAVAILNIIDLLYTVSADGIGKANHVDMLHEMNPLAAVFLQLGLVPSLICFKVLMVAGGLGLLWKLRQSRWVVPACWLLLVAYIILSGMWCVWVHDVNQSMEMQLAAAPP